MNDSKLAANIVLYTRSGCQLCDEALEVLRQNGVAHTLVDIDSEPAIRERFNTCVPVVEIDGRIRFRGRVEPMLLRRILRNRR